MVDLTQVKQRSLGEKLLSKMQETSRKGEQIPNEDGLKESLRRLLSNTAGESDVTLARRFVGEDT